MLYRSEERWNGPLKSGDETFLPRAGGDFLAEIEGRVEGVEGDDALRPIDDRREREPNARDNAIGAPSVQKFVDSFAFVEDQTRLGFHGDDFQGSDGVEITQVPVGYRADATRTAAEESADGCFDERGRVAAKLPASFAGFVFEDTQPHARLANGDTVRLNGFDFIHAHQIEDDTALERDRLAVIAGARAANRDREILRVAVAEDILNLFCADRLDDDLAYFAVKLFAEDRRVPVKVA